MLTGSLTTSAAGTPAAPVTALAPLIRRVYQRVDVRDGTHRSRYPGQTSAYGADRIDQ
ncbi:MULTISPECIES: hypothetical protein [unclassified Streptomyces]|uniref:hypothetical protein n=1 Tax=unclassified Streptomyces TaxID=2593676 RepID=UPI002E29805D|nr:MULTISPECIES: hypothetical protein [unclassified Streptomyces]